MKRDTLVFDIINQELARQRRGIELIASENFTSLQVMQAMGGVMTNKYAEGYPGRRYYGGCEIVDKTEQLAIDRAKEFYESITLNDFPQEGLIQLQNATLQVFSSWFSEDAVLYRRQYNIPHDLGTTVTVVQMKLGNSLKDNAGSGVLLTMNPQTLDQSPIVAFVEHQQGTAVVGENKHSYTEINQLPQTVNQQLVSLLEIINDKLRPLKNHVFRRSHPEEGHKSRRRISYRNVVACRF